MFSRIRKRLTFANVAMTLALVFAMSGGAYAAGKYLINSTKQINPKVLKALKGAKGVKGEAGAKGETGPAGTNGKDGAPGAAGKDGLPGGNGKDGLPGSDGESVTAVEFSTNVGKCNGTAEGLGGSEFKVGATTTLACNGKTGSQGIQGIQGIQGASVTNTPLAAENGSGHCEEGGAEFKVGAGTPSYACAGSPWTAGGTLPSGQSEKGAWGSFFARAGFDPISFTIPLKTAPLEAVFVEESTTDSTILGHCKGTLAVPTAKPGYLCVYAGEPSMNSATPPEPTVSFWTIRVPGTNTNGAGTTGAVVVVAETGAGSPTDWTGTWAVTAA
jgi:hypothetical protein